MATPRADAVLGWGGRRYLATRPGRSTPEAWRTAPEQDQAVPVAGGRHRTLPERGHRTLATTALASLALLIAVLAAQNWSAGDGMPAPNTPT